jgi:thiamine biosynthesis lipoprotein
VNSFRAMGCDVQLPYGAPIDSVQALFHARDACFSRFNDSSELNAINAVPLGVAVVSEDFASMLTLAIDAARATGGLISPAVGAAILAAGYDRDFHRVPRDVGAVEPAEVPPLEAISLRGRVLLRAAPVTLDLNGVVKGKTVDDALALLDGSGWVSAGGDVAAAEPVVVGLPGGDAITVHSGGLATSSVAKRSWLADGERQHHLIDPRSGAPAASPWRDVTVAAPTCLRADVAAKAALILGFDGPWWLERQGLAGRFVDHHGHVTLTSRWAHRAPRTVAA